MPRRLTLTLVVASLVLVAAEAISAAFFNLYSDRFAWRDASAYAREPTPWMRELFDPQLGWTRGYGTRFGERPREREHELIWLSAFGDSFTHGDEVTDTQTWCESLARRTGTAVLNFGGSGYGPDQALLLFRKKRAVAARGRVVVLGSGLENINRIVNRYRPFYAKDTGLPFTKPRFVVRGPRLVLLANPTRSADELSRLANPAFLHEIGQEDYWYTRVPRPTLSFPFLRLAFHPAIWRQALEGTPRAGDAAPRGTLWNVQEARRLFVAIVDAFASEARAAGLKPVFVIMPAAGQVIAVLEERPVPGTGLLTRRCRELGIPLFNGNDAIAAAVLETETAVGAYYMAGGHLSPLGNETFAASFLRFLEEAGLAPVAADRTTPESS